MATQKVYILDERTHCQMVSIGIVRIKIEIMFEDKAINHIDWIGAAFGEYHPESIAGKNN